MSEEKEEMPQPEGQPDYQRMAEGRQFGCWIYPDSKAVHGRLLGKGGEIFGKKEGEEIETGFGTLVWRGHYKKEGSKDKSTGWLFIQSFSGPPFIRDKYDPKTGELPF